MKTLKSLSLLLLLLIAGFQITNAQTTKKQKQAAKEAAIKKSINAKQYTFVANYVLPQRGGGRILTSDYDLRVKPDSVISFLPYFGRAYFDVAYNPAEGGIKFTSTKFGYEVKEKNKGGWEITIKPADAKNTDKLILNISSDGYASLSVTSNNRDFITFDGYLK